MKAYVRTLLVLIALLTVASFATAFAQDKAKWTGTWKMVPEKSKFAGEGPTSLVLKLELKEGAVTETLTVTNPNGDRSFTATYTTDGKAVTQQVMGRTAQTSAKWEGDVLVISFSDERGGFARKITLSPDGKTMTIAAHQTNENNERDETIVLEKQ
jgi:hypothetical protein